jgi:hypothetical protein
MPRPKKVAKEEGKVPSDIPPASNVDVVLAEKEEIEKRLSRLYSLKAELEKENYPLDSRLTVEIEQKENRLKELNK